MDRQKRNAATASRGCFSRQTDHFTMGTGRDQRTAGTFTRRGGPTTTLVTAGSLLVNIAGFLLSVKKFRSGARPINRSGPNDLTPH
ncbi:hypothetical protein APED_18500 [Acanthopleuribacter pedis]